MPIYTFSKHIWCHRNSKGLNKSDRSLKTVHGSDLKIRNCYFFLPHVEYLSLKLWIDHGFGIGVASVTLELRAVLEEYMKIVISAKYSFFCGKDYPNSLFKN